MTMLGVLGEYLWRALGEARRRPQYNIETDSRDLLARLRSTGRSAEGIHDNVEPASARNWDGRL